MAGRTKRGKLTILLIGGADCLKFGWWRMRSWGGAQGRNRTADTVIFSHVLYQLSYLGMSAGQAEESAYRGA